MKAHPTYGMRLTTPEDDKRMVAGMPSPRQRYAEDIIAIVNLRHDDIAYGCLRALNPDALFVDEVRVAPAAGTGAVVSGLMAFLFEQAQPCCKAIHGLPGEYLSPDLASLPTSGLFESGQFEQALHVLESIPEASLDTASRIQMARCHLQLNQPDRAHTLLVQALREETGLMHVWLALGDWEAVHGDMSACIECYRRASGLGTLSVQAHVNLEYALRSQGRFAEAARETEWQLQRNPIDTEYYRHGWLTPRWQGERRANQSLLVHGVDGYGDMILCARYLPLAAKAVPRLTVECPAALLRLFRASFPDLSMIPPSRTYPQGYEAFTSLVALPAFFDPSNELSSAYLSVGKGSSGTVRRHATPTIGINRLASHYSPMRSMPAECLPLIAAMLPGTLVSLMPSPPIEEQLLLQRYGIRDAGSSFNDFFDAALAIERLDLVISVDTALAHLAAAMGKPTLLLLSEPVAPMWRNHSVVQPLYPSMTRLTKPAEMAWTTFLSRRHDAIRAAGSSVAPS